MNENEKKNSVDHLSEREVVSSREFPLPPERVFAAFRDPVRLAEWWGPHGFTNTIREFDLRPGGRWHLVMHGPNGADFENESVFVEVRPPHRVVFDHLEPVHRFRMTMDFAPRDGGTVLTWRMCFDSEAECARSRPLVTAGNEQNFDRLAAHLAR